MILNNKEFAFRLSKEKLMEVKDLSPEDKLDWLEESNKFVDEFVFHRKLRHGKRASNE